MEMIEVLLVDGRKVHINAGQVAAIVPTDDRKNCTLHVKGFSPQANVPQLAVAGTADALAERINKVFHNAKHS
jgi:hypothetical protein